MTKQLLTALLIAGLSATAKAEPVVYYCTTTKASAITQEKIVKIRPSNFKLFIGLSDSYKLRVKISGDGLERVLGGNDPFSTAKPYLHPLANEDSFFAHSPNTSMTFVNGVLAYSSTQSSPSVKSSRIFTITSFIASCDRF